MFKIKNNVSNPIINNMFSDKSLNCNLMSNITFHLPKINTINYGTKSIRYLGAKLWNSLPVVVFSLYFLKIFVGVNSLL